MPFSSACTWRTFDREAIENLKPDQNGVYGIARNGLWIYVGKGDIRDRMLDHFNGDIPCIQRNGATHWIAEVTANMDAREIALILELKPCCNKRVG